jgi:hypothetical protein
MAARYLRSCCIVAWNYRRRCHLATRSVSSANHFGAGKSRLCRRRLADLAAAWQVFVSWKEPWSWAWVWGLGEKNSTSVCSLQLSRCPTRKAKSMMIQSNWYLLLDYLLPPQCTSCDDTKDCATMPANRLPSQATTFFKTTSCFQVPKTSSRDHLRGMRCPILFSCFC